MRLLRRAVHAARDAGCSEVHLVVRAAAAQKYARALYEQLGIKKASVSSGRVQGVDGPQVKLARGQEYWVGTTKNSRIL
jgi:ribosomal protein S18 acetylase RimI-like enzyme